LALGNHMSRCEAQMLLVWVILLAAGGIRL